MPETFESYAATALPALLRLAGALAGDRATAEDVVQEVLIRAAGRWSAIQEADSPHAYVRRMVVNEYLTWRRKHWRLIPRAEVGPDQLTPDHADQHAERAAMQARLDRLPPQQRAALVLRFYEGLPDDVIGDVLGCTEGTVRSHVSRGLAALRIELVPSDHPVAKEN